MCLENLPRYKKHMQTPHRKRAGCFIVGEKDDQRRVCLDPEKLKWELSQSKHSNIWKGVPTQKGCNHKKGCNVFAYLGVSDIVSESLRGLGCMTKWSKRMRLQMQAAKKV